MKHTHSHCDFQARGEASSRKSRSVPPSFASSKFYDDPLETHGTARDDECNFVLSGLDTSANPPADASALEFRVSKHDQITFTEDLEGSGVYFLSQSVAIVRHAERLDRTPDWHSFPDRETWPNDTPLAPDGHEHAKELGRELKGMEKRFDLIVSSPYLRCAQTACEIATEMNLPIQFDLDLGEVFDSECMGPNVRDPQHRDSADLEAQLAHAYPDVTLIRDDSNAVSIEGRQQVFPEALSDARMRFIFKVQQLLQKAASELMSLVVVTHGDAVGAIIGMLRYDWKVQQVPYAAYAVASRRVPVLEKSSDAMKLDEPVYEHPEQWDVDLRGGIEVTEVHAFSKKRAEALHKHELKKIGSNSSISAMDSSYLHKVNSSGSIHSMDSTPTSPVSSRGPWLSLPISPAGSAASSEMPASPTDSQLKPFSDDQISGFMQTLRGFGANSNDSARLVKLAGFSHHLADEDQNRVASPPVSPKVVKRGSTTLTRTVTL